MPRKSLRRGHPGAYARRAADRVIGRGPLPGVGGTGRGSARAPASGRHEPRVLVEERVQRSRITARIPSLDEDGVLVVAHQRMASPVATSE